MAKLNYLDDVIELNEKSEIRLVELMKHQRVPYYTLHFIVNSSIHRDNHCFILSLMKINNSVLFVKVTSKPLTRGHTYIQTHTQTHIW